MKARAASGPGAVTAAPVGYKLPEETAAAETDPFAEGAARVAGMLLPLEP